MDFAYFISCISCTSLIMPFKELRFGSVFFGSGVAWSDSCEKEYLNELPRLCWVMTVTPCWPHGFPHQRLVSSFRISKRRLVAVLSFPHEISTLFDLGLVA